MKAQQTPDTPLLTELFVRQRKRVCWKESLFHRAIHTFPQDKDVWLHVFVVHAKHASRAAQTSLYLNTNVWAQRQQTNTKINLVGNHQDIVCGAYFTNTSQVTLVRNNNTSLTLCVE
jgi:hypothetical protein